MTDSFHSSALFPPLDERIAADNRLTDVLWSAHGRLGAASVMPVLDMPAFREALAGFDFQTPRPLEGVLDWTVSQLEHGIVQMANPRYFGLFNPVATFPAQCADRITSLFNPQLASSASSPVPVALESHVIRAIAERAVRPEAPGISQPADRSRTTPR